MSSKRWRCCLISSALLALGCTATVAPARAAEVDDGVMATADDSTPVAKRATRPKPIVLEGKPATSAKQAQNTKQSQNGKSTSSSKSTKGTTRTGAKPVTVRTSGTSPSIVPRTQKSSIRPTASRSTTISLRRAKTKPTRKGKGERCGRSVAS